MEKIILFDGSCHFCDRSVQFIMKRDPKRYFSFASLQSEVGKNLLTKNQIPNEIDSLVYIDKDRSYVKSTAALHISKHLKGAWKLLYVLLLVPKPLRDLIYDVFARNRYKWFGKNESCALLTPEDKKRFL